MKNFELSITRALNATRRTSPISYIALRSLIDSFPPGRENDCLENIISRLLQTTKRWDYRNYKIFKEKKDNELEYRELTIGTPLTLLAETILIDYLHKNKVYNDNPNVYSYRTPLYSNSGQNFSFFMHGYKKRNQEIENRLSQGMYAYIFDIRKFYPNIDKEKMVSIFNKKINQKINSKEKKEQFDIFLNSLLMATQNGIAANPDFGHICADFYLEEFDSLITDKFGSKNYFRYVDDIVIISDKNNSQEKIIEIINQYLPAGLELNEEKTDFVDYNKWMKVSFDDIDSVQNDFSEFLTSLTIDFALHPKKLSEIKKLFNENNIFLPFDKIFANSEYKRQLRFYKNFFFKKPKYLSYLLGKIDSHLKNAEVLKEKLIKIIEKIPDMSNTKGYERRLLIQKYRYCINRLLVFSGKELLEKVLYHIPDEEEFIEIRILVVSLINNDVSELIHYNGNIILSFCELWKSNLKDRPTIEIKEDTKIDNTFDSILTLIIHGVLPSEIIPKEKINKELDSLLVFANKAKRKDIEISIDYYDEVSSLLSFLHKSKIGEFITTRYSDGESIDLDTLKIGRNGSS